MNPPHAATLGGGVPTLSADDSFTVVWNPQSGRIACWGSNIDGDRNNTADIREVRRNAADTNHTLALREFGTPFADGDAAADDCPCGRGDLNADGFVDTEDLSTLISLWGYIDAETGDVDTDHVVDGDDLARLLQN